MKRRLVKDSRGLNFEKELDHFMGIAKYIHISDNNNMSDQNKPLVKGSKLHSLLNKYN